MKQTISCLLIDDDRDDQEIFKLALQDVNENVLFRAADDGVEGLALLQSEEQFRPNFIFLDLNMPRMTGKDCLAAIRQHPTLSGIPVVIYSTSSDPKDIQDTQALGATDYVVKQYSITSLKEILRRFFN